MELPDEALFALSSMILIGAFILLWGTFYRMIASVFARGVLVGNDNGQFSVVAFDLHTGHTETLKLSVTFPPHRKKAVLRSISSWGVVCGKSIISIEVNQPGGQMLYKSY